MKKPRRNDPDVKIVSRKEAKALGLGKYFTGKPCKHGHVSERHVFNTNCVICGRTQKRAWRKANPEKVRAQKRARYAANPEKGRNRVRTWAAANPEKHRARARAWAKANPDKDAARFMRRHANKLKAMPVWACKKSIENIYAEAQRLTINTGIPHHVDHTIPLKHPLVCGLHVEHNLRVIPAVDNLKKHNQFDV